MEVSNDPDEIGMIPFDFESNPTVYLTILVYPGVGNEHVIKPSSDMDVFVA